MLSPETFRSCDVAVMTYGTLLRDVTELSQREFHYVILDEARAITNSSARTAKAAKCLQAQHRRVMTGTPIENHLGKLSSLMKFRNPALARHLRNLAGGSVSESPLLSLQLQQPVFDGARADEANGVHPAGLTDAVRKLRGRQRN